MAKKASLKRRSRNPSRRTDSGKTDDSNARAAIALRRAAWTIGIVLVTGLVLIAAASAGKPQPQRATVAPVDKTAAASGPIPTRNPLDGERAFRYLEQICALGRRPSGSPGMKQQQVLVKKHFESLGGKVSLQEFQAANPLGGDKVPMANLIVTWHPDRKDRVLLCAHYDTRPFPDSDPDPVKKRKGLFIGANDGASGVAIMMELAHLMARLECRYGVDFVLFDGEELVYDADRDPYFLGSEHFAREYVRRPPEHKYKWGVVMDMVGDADLQIYQEQHSITWRETRPLVTQIWGLAQRMGVTEFVAQAGYLIRDDHLALRNIARIPTCDVIDFDYQDKWHTEADTPSQCSPASLAKVGWVMYEWFKRAE
ncbi:MAG: M28 family peptidase [Pirellulales bacterium]